MREAANLGLPSLHSCQVSRLLDLSHQKTISFSRINSVTQRFIKYFLWPMSTLDSDSFAFGLKLRKSIKLVFKLLFVIFWEYLFHNRSNFSWQQAVWWSMLGLCLSIKKQKLRLYSTNFLSMGKQKKQYTVVLWRIYCYFEKQNT